MNVTTHFIEKTDSTNRHLADMVDKKKAGLAQLQDFTVVYTNEQTAGRGMGSNRWQSECGENILASFYFEPNIEASQQFFLNRFFALAVREMLSHYAEAVIKWPNDIYIAQHKIAGILIEHTLVGTKLEHTIAGVGININQTAFSSEIPHPISLKQVTGKDFPVDQLLDELIASCLHYYLLLKERDFDLLEKEYLQHLYRLNEPAAYLYENSTITATITGIDRYGRLMLQKEDGTPLTCGYKEIAFL